MASDEIRSEIKQEHVKLCLEFAAALERLAKEDQSAAGYRTNKAVAWEAQATRVREWIA